MYPRSVFAHVVVLASALLLTASCSQRQWEPLFSGEDMSGWEHVGAGGFEIEDGALTTQGGMGLLWYAGNKIGDATIRIVYKPDGPRHNAGVFIRIPEQPRDAWFPVHRGYDVQIQDDGDEFHRTGAIYSMSSAETFPPSSDPDGWNTMEITLQGQTTTVTVNGKQVNRFDSSQPMPERKRWFEPRRGPRPDSGFFGLQNHDENSIVRFREVSVSPLPE